MEKMMKSNETPNDETKKAIEEGRQIADDNSVPGFKDTVGLAKSILGSLPSDISLDEVKYEHLRKKYGLGEDFEKDEK